MPRACVGPADALPYLPVGVAPRVGAALRLADRARALSGTLQTDVLDACRGVAAALGCPPSGADVASACETARSCLASGLASAPTPTAHVIGGRCEGSVGLSVACQTECAGDASCVAMCLAAVELDSFCLLPKIDPTVPGAAGLALSTWLPPLDVVQRHRGPLARAALDAPANAALLVLTGDDACVSSGRDALLVARAAVSANVESCGAVVLTARLDD